MNGFKRLLDDGTVYCVRFEYTEQSRPERLAQALIIGEELVGDDAVCLVGEYLLWQGLVQCLNLQ